MRLQNPIEMHRWLYESRVVSKARLGVMYCQWVSTNRTVFIKSVGQVRNDWLLPEHFLIHPIHDSKEGQESLNVVSS